MITIDQFESVVPAEAVCLGRPWRTRAAPRAMVGTAAPAPSTFEPGAILRVKLHNFLTYDDVEFRPGPRLNVIMGPNGTGASSKGVGRREGSARFAAARSPWERPPFFPVLPDLPPARQS